MRKLLLLVDLNGTMGYRSEAPIIGFPTKCIRKRYFYPRPDAADFLKEMAKYYDVCIYTSVMYHNACDICNMIDPAWKNYITKIYDRDYNKKDPNGVEEWDTIRDMNLIMRDSKRNMSSIILLDNELRKFSEYPYNGLIVPEYGPTQVKRGDKSTLLQLSVYLKDLHQTYEKEWRKSFDVTTYIKNNPLSQCGGKSELAQLTEKIANLEMSDILDMEKYGSASMRFLESKAGILIFQEASIQSRIIVEIQNSNCMGHFTAKMQLAHLLEESGVSCKLFVDGKLVRHDTETCKKFLLNQK